MIITMDIPEDCLDQFREMCERNNIKISSFNLSGPGGGNPEFKIIVETKAEGQAILDFYFN